MQWQDRWDTRARPVPTPSRGSQPSSGFVPTMSGLPERTPRGSQGPVVSCRWLREWDRRHLPCTSLPWKRFTVPGCQDFSKRALMNLDLKVHVSSSHDMSFVQQGHSHPAAPSLLKREKKEQALLGRALSSSGGASVWCDYGSQLLSSLCSGLTLW